VRLPWWLNPWREVRRYRVAADFAGQQAREMLISLSERNTGIIRLNREIASLRGQLAAAVTDARTSGAALSTAPEFIMAGIPRGPGMGKRIQVSREVEVTAFAMTEMGQGEPRFKIGAIMARLLVIDKPTYAECLAYLAMIWENQDREAVVALETGQAVRHEPVPDQGMWQLNSGRERS
jgi:hypothetical protein